MDPVSKLILASSEVRRRLWASLSWNERFAEVFTVLAEATHEPFSRAMAAMFLLAGVRGMPPIKGQSPEEFMAAFKGGKHGQGSWHSQVNALTAMLPRGYAGVIGGAAFKQALAVSRNNIDTAEDILSMVLTTFLGGAGQNIKPVSFGEAIKLVQTSAHNTGINLGKKRQREVMPGAGEEDDERSGIPEGIAPGVHNLDELAHKHVKLLLEAMHSSALKSELEHIHPSAVQYVELLLEGYDKSEILGMTPRGQALPGGSKLKHPVTKSGQPLTPQNWSPYEKKIFDTIRGFAAKHHIHEQREHMMEPVYAYDRTASESQMFHNVDEIEKAYPNGMGWQTRTPFERFFHKFRGVKVEVKTVAEERWQAIVHGLDGSIEGGQATTPINAIRQAMQEALKKSKAKK